MLGWAKDKSVGSGHPQMPGERRVDDAHGNQVHGSRVFEARSGTLIFNVLD